LCATALKSKRQNKTKKKQKNKNKKQKQNKKSSYPQNQHETPGRKPNADKPIHSF